MFHKFALGIVAAASIGAAALSPTAASAKPFGFAGGLGGGWGYHHFHHRFGFGLGYGGDGCYVRRPVLTPFGYRIRFVNVCY